MGPVAADVLARPVGLTSTCMVLIYFPGIFWIPTEKCSLINLLLDGLFVRVHFRGSSVSWNGRPIATITGYVENISWVFIYFSRFRYSISLCAAISSRGVSSMKLLPAGIYRAMGNYMYDGAVVEEIISRTHVVWQCNFICGLFFSSLTVLQGIAYLSCYAHIMYLRRWQVWTNINILASCEPIITNFDLIAFKHIKMNKSVNDKIYAMFIGTGHFKLPIRYAIQRMNEL